jgi:hypothetical protein
MNLIENKNKDSERTESRHPRILLPGNTLPGKTFEETSPPAEGSSIRKDLRNGSAVALENVAMMCGQICLLVSHGRPVSPVKEEGIGHEEIDVPAQQTEAGVNTIIGKIIGMTDHPINALMAKHNISDKDSFGYKMEKASGREQQEADNHYPVRNSTE